MRWGVNRCPFSRRIWWQLIGGGYYSRVERLLQQVANAVTSDPVIARGGRPEAISQSFLCIFHFDFWLLLLSSNMVTGSSLRTVLLPLKRDLKLVQEKGKGIAS
jgi:hypothetical protein